MYEYVLTTDTWVSYYSKYDYKKLWRDIKDYKSWKKWIVLKYMHNDEIIYEWNKKYFERKYPGYVFFKMFKKEVNYNLFFKELVLNFL